MAEYAPDSASESWLSTSRQIKAFVVTWKTQAQSPTGRDIIARLRLEAGHIMEDMADELAGTLPKDTAVLGVALGEARHAADDIQALLAAAQVLQRRCLASNG